MRYILTLVSLMKYIGIIFKLQGDSPTLLCRLFEKLVTPVMLYKYNQGAIAIAVSPKFRPRTKDIAIKHHHFWSIVANGDVK